MILLLALACGAPSTSADSAEPDLSTCDASGGRQHWVLNSLLFVRVEEDGSSDGFDLDGAVTDFGDSAGCGIPDMVSPTGQVGVDNAFARLIPVLETTEFISAETIIDAHIKNGEILLIPEIAGAEDLQQDECVSIALRRGTGEPMTDTTGSMLPAQTFDLDPEFPAVEIPEVSIVDGQVEGGPITLDLALDILDASIRFTLLDGMIRYQVHEDGTISGVVGGGLSTDQLREVSQAANIMDDVFELIDSLVDSVADLAPDAEGQCTQVSVTLKFTGVPVYVFEDAFE